MSRDADTSVLPEPWTSSSVGVGSRNASNPGWEGSVTVETLLPSRLVRTVSTPT